MKLWRLRVLYLVLWATGSATTAAKDRPLLIRPLNVYEGLIKDVHDYFNNTCIILFHASPNPIETHGLEDVEELLALQMYLSGSLSVRTSIMDFHMFKRQVGHSYYHIKRPLFVLLNDLNETKDQFIKVSEWIAMAYPTWLLFLRDDTRPEDFLSQVHVPFDCILMVAQRNLDGTGEAIRDVYRINKKDHLRADNFGNWDEVHGLRGPTLGLYQRRHDLQGQTINVVSIQDPPVSRLVKDAHNRTIGLNGFFGDVIQLLQIGMNCTLVCGTDVLALPLSSFSMLEVLADLW